MLIKEIEYNNGKFPKETLQKAIAQREEIIPELLEILDYTCQNAEQLAEEENYIAHIYALYLLAQFREEKAYPLIYNLLNKPQDILNNLLGDVITEGLPGILASVCGGDIELIKKIIENAQIDEFIRGSALNSLVILVAQGIKSRDEVLNYFGNLFRGKLERTYSHVWDDLVACSSRLYPEEIIGDIELAYDEELVNPLYIDLEDIQAQLRKNKRTVLSELYNAIRYQLINDTIHELEGWACFDEKNHDISIPLNDILKFNKQEPYRKEFKVGRNDPCPCGSGKKYKKCCGK